MVNMANGGFIGNSYYFKIDGISKSPRVKCYSWEETHMFLNIFLWETFTKKQIKIKIGVVATTKVFLKNF
jgi:hypothetical protein